MGRETSHHAVKWHHIVTMGHIYTIIHLIYLILCCAIIPGVSLSTVNTPCSSYCPEDRPTTLYNVCELKYM